MEKKPCLILDNEFLQYCKLNNIEDVEQLAKDVFSHGFTILKYGSMRFMTDEADVIVREPIMINESKSIPDPPKEQETHKKDLYDE